VEFLGPLQRFRLDRINDVAVPVCSAVDAAVAYIHDDRTLIAKCFDLKKPLHLRGRYDWGGPIGMAILEKFLRCTSPDYRLTLVPDIFHPKVIWWRGYGAYIGSANLTNKAWFANIEAGVFLDEEELVDQGIGEELERFFDYIDGVAHPLSQGIVDQLKQSGTDPELLRREREAKRRFEESRLIPRLQGLDSVQKVAASVKREGKFLAEWNSTLKILTDIGTQLKQHRPRWVPEDTPTGVHADQFLHGYYYQTVRGASANEHPYEEFHETNRNRVGAALGTAMEWWANLETAPGLEDRMITEWAVELRGYLAEERLKNLNPGEFTELCRRVHAFRNHAARVSHTAMDLPHKLPRMEVDERIEVVAEWLFRQRSLKRETPLDAIRRVLYGGPPDQVPRRIFEAGYDPMRKIPHMGLSLFGEIAGWAMPNRFPPRNGRTSKALRALGFDVKVY
jgi:hypothetical protein